MTDHQTVQKTADLSQLKQRALSWLARREYAVHELRSKLLRNGAENNVVEQLIGDLLTAGYLSDERYAEMLLRRRYNQSKGPVYVQRELAQHQVPSAIITQAFSQFEGDWFESAAELRRRKFSDANISDYKTRAKQMRFLAARGFTTEQMEYAMTAKAEN